MNHNVTLAIVAVVAAMTLTAVAFAIPQQALAYRHHNNHNNHNNSVKVNQLNNCTGAPQKTVDNGAALQEMGTASGTVCLNSGDNSADIHK
jgi:hypothetical protein